MEHEITEKEKQTIKNLLGEIEIFITYLDKKRKNYSDKAEEHTNEENKLTQKKWLEKKRWAKNKLTEWEIIKKLVEDLKEEELIYDEGIRLKVKYYSTKK